MALLIHRATEVSVGKAGFVTSQSSVASGNSSLKPESGSVTFAVLCNDLIAVHEVLSVTNSEFQVAYLRLAASPNLPSHQESFGASTRKADPNGNLLFSRHWDFLPFHLSYRCFSSSANVRPPSACPLTPSSSCQTAPAGPAPRMLWAAILCIMGPVSPVSRGEVTCLLSDGCATRPGVPGLWGAS